MADEWHYTAAFCDSIDLAQKRSGGLTIRWLIGQNCQPISLPGYRQLDPWRVIIQLREVRNPSADVIARSGATKQSPTAKYVTKIKKSCAYTNARSNK